MTLLALIEASARSLADAGVSFGHGTTNAHDEAAWLVLWQLGLPLDTALDGEDSHADQPLTPEQLAQVQALVAQRIHSRKPAAYLTREAWLQGFSFYVDERVIVPRSLIAELLVDGGMAISCIRQPTKCSICVPATAAWPCWPRWFTRT